MPQNRKRRQRVPIRQAGSVLRDEILHYAPFLRQGRQNDGRKTRRARSFI